MELAEAELLFDRLEREVIRLEYTGPTMGKAIIRVCDSLWACICMKADKLAVSVDFKTRNIYLRVYHKVVRDTNISEDIGYLIDKE